MTKPLLVKRVLFPVAALVALFSGGAICVLMQPVFFPPELAVPPSVSAAGLERHVRMLSETFHPRSYDRKDNIEAAAAYIESRLKEAGARVRSEEFSLPQGDYRNIIGVYGPEQGPVLIVGAHYDTNRDETDDGFLYTPGADDNASGVAGLLALAALLREQPPEIQVMLVAYSLEEPPFFGTEQMGSAVHATFMNSRGQEVVGMISLEMIGCFSDSPGSQTYPLKALEWLYPRTGNYIGVVGRIQDISLTRSVKRAMKAATGLPVYSMNALPWVPGLDYSDHRNYWPYGYTAVMITDTAFYRNGNYHMAGDTADTLDYTRMAKVVQGVFSAVRHIASEHTQRSP